MTKITAKIAQRHVSQMLDMLYSKDSFLLKKSLNITERAITHRMGLYLQELIVDFDVDCEYNRMGKIAFGEFEYTDGDYFVKTVSLSEGSVSDADDKGSRVYPDIIVHKRGTANNLIIIEVKVKWKSDKASHDIEKLLAYKNDLKYKYAFYIELTEKRKDVSVQLQ